MMKKRFAGSTEATMGDLKVYAETEHPAAAKN